MTLRCTEVLKWLNEFVTWDILVHLRVEGGEVMDVHVRMFAQDLGQEEASKG